MQTLTNNWWYYNHFLLQTSTKQLGISVSCMAEFNVECFRLTESVNKCHG